MSGIYSAYCCLVAAAMFEVLWVLGIRLSAGLTKWPPLLLAAVSMLLSLFLLAKASQQLPVAMAYAAWVGLGITGTALLQHFYFAQTIPAIGWLCLLLLIAAIVGLQLTAPAAH